MMTTRYTGEQIKSGKMFYLPLNMMKQVDCFSFINSNIKKSILLNDSCTLSTLSDSNIYCHNIPYYWDLSYKSSWQKKLPLVCPNDIIRLNDTSFAISGSKNKNCWFAVMDTSGKILEEHEISNRQGTFYNISLNKDGSFLLLGSLYKNSFTPIVKQNQKEIHIESIAKNGMIICRTKPYLKNFPNDIIKPELSDQEAEINLSPNPASDFIEISVGANGPSPLQSEVKIYDIYGQNVLSVVAIHELPLQVNVSGLAPGMYFVRIGDRVGKFMKL
jgi:hypothetical protein